MFKNTKKTSYFSALVILQLFLFGCASNKLQNPPKLNPKPKNLLIVNGHKFSELNLRFWFVYATSNKACRVSPIFISPAISQVINKYYHFPPGVTNFKFKVELDKYLSGECNWHPIRLMASTWSQEKVKGIKDGSWRNIHEIDMKLQNSTKSLKENFICKLSNNKDSYSCHRKDFKIRRKNNNVLQNIPFKGGTTQINYEIQ